ncbi:MAG: rhodanese-like domain-containing protein [Actinobacteria bacterium]|nr:rhodanese-like domain-containing protein [Actinomycetota bacterium]MBI3686272.1 rhodanese-like domain-containing protein [Actinomycetota bacterium]
MQQVPHIPYVEVPAVPGDALLLDVREPDEWSAGRVKDSLHVPMGQVPARLADIPADRRIVVVCRSGGRSARVTEFLRQHGYDAVNLNGGLQAWDRAGRSLVSDNAGVGQLR